MSKFIFDSVDYITFPNPACPILYRINQHRGEETKDIFWGGYSDNNRFSLDGIKQTYLGTSLDVLSEAAPWRNWFHEGIGETSEDAGNRKLLLPISEDELSDYFVSFIMPDFPLKLLKFEGDLKRYNANNNIANGADLTESKQFSKQCHDHTSVDGIYYSSRQNTYGNNIYLYDRCKKKFSEKSIICNKPLIEVIKPMKAFIEESLGLEFLI